MPQKFLVGGEWRTSDEVMEVKFPYDGTVVDSVYMAQRQDLDDAMNAAVRGFEVTRKLPAYKRTEILWNLQRLMREHFDELVDLMIMEGGKNRKTAGGEMSRALQTIGVSAEEAHRIGGEVFSIDWTPAGANRQGFTRRAPIGTILCITPFNYPINLACHKIGPAIATGNAFILKPAEKTPLSSVLLGELVLEAGYPPEAVNMLNCWGPLAGEMVEDDRIAMISFTGSASVGWMLKSKAGRKKVVLELGGNAGFIVHSDADMALAVREAASGGFANAGQNCISVQRMLVQQDVFEEFADGFVEAVKRLKVGDPRDADTDIGPLINEREAERVENWVSEAVRAGAALLYGGTRQGAMFPPTVLGQTTPEMRVNCEEVFAPVVTLRPYRTWDDAITIINDSPYGLQAGVFTRDIKRIMDAWERIDVGGLHINSASTFRVDHMPYGGIKASGLGREGVKYAIEDMTEIRLMVVNLNE
ncbi:MAG: aldehyde dehydrogenase family protein [Anaerolineae bacterium]|nr:aldehyde dehydrogenase family protein [Anaerolineae bacterium]